MKQLQIENPKISSMRGLIVSCQAQPDEPMHGSNIMAAFARAAEQGGAKGIRANGPNDIRAIRQAVKLPIIGLYKVDYPNTEVYITPTFAEAKAIAEAGADIIALDATLRKRPYGVSIQKFIKKVKLEFGLPILADISTFEEGLAAEKAGVDAISTTMSGYTPYSLQSKEPDLELLKKLAESCALPVILEGRVSNPEHVSKAFELGAFAVVIGAAITRPQIITQNFVMAVPPIDQ